MYGLIYKITNLLDGKIYVGQTTQKLELRLKYHKSSKHTFIGRAIRKHGWKNFKAEVIEECESQEQLNEREVFWIAKLNCKKPNGYNLTDGGERNFKMVESVRKKISLAGMGRKLSAETKAKISASNKKNYAENPDRRLKISIANTGNQHSKGVVPSIETRKKISDAKKNLSVETHRKLSAAQIGNKKKLGFKCSDETKFKMSNARKKIVYPVLESELNKLKLTHCGLARQMDNISILGKLNGRRNLDLKTAEEIKNFLKIDLPLEKIFNLKE